MRNRSANHDQKKSRFARHVLVALVVVTLLGEGWITIIKHQGLGGKQGAQFDILVTMKLASYRFNHTMDKSDPDRPWLRFVRRIGDFYYASALAKLPASEPVREAVWGYHVLAPYSNSEARSEELLQHLPVYYEILLREGSMYSKFDERVRYSSLAGALLYYRTHQRFSEVVTPEKIAYRKRLVDLTVAHYPELAARPGMQNAWLVGHFEYAVEATLLLITQMKANGDAGVDDCGESELFAVFEQISNDALDLEGRLKVPGALHDKDDLALFKFYEDSQMPTIQGMISVVRRHISEECQFK